MGEKLDRRFPENIYLCIARLLGGVLVYGYVDAKRTHLIEQVRKWLCIFCHIERVDAKNDSVTCIQLNDFSWKIAVRRRPNVYAITFQQIEKIYCVHLRFRVTY